MWQGDGKVLQGDGRVMGRCGRVTWGSLAVGDQDERAVANDLLDTCLYLGSEFFFDIQLHLPVVGFAFCMVEGGMVEGGGHDAPFLLWFSQRKFGNKLKSKTLGTDTLGPGHSNMWYPSPPKGELRVRKGNARCYEGKRGVGRYLSQA